MATKANSVRRTLFPYDTDDIVAAKSTNTAYDKFTAIRWITPNTLCIIVSATLLTIYGKVQTQILLAHTIRRLGAFSLQRNSFKMPNLFGKFSWKISS